MLISILLIAGCLPEAKPETRTQRDARWETLETSLRDKLGDSYDAPVAGLTSANIDNGRNIYQKSCVACHGSEMDGRGGRASTLSPAPSALVGPDSQRFSDAGQLHLIAHGVPGTAMAAWGPRFGDAQVLDVYAYIVSQRQPR